MANRDDILAQMQANLKEAGVESTKKDCGIALDAALNAVATTALSEVDGAVRTTIGTFKRKDTEARTGRNPRTGEPVEIAAKTTLVFKASQSLSTPIKSAKKAPAAKAKATPAKATPKKAVVKKKK